VLRLLIVLAVLGIAIDGSIQAQTAATAGTKAAWKAPRTPDGQPDLQGVWTNPTITPLERPANMAGKATLTEQEVAELEKQSAQRAASADDIRPKGNVGAYNQFWMDSGTKVVSTRQTSLVVDPPDGRVPLTQEALNLQRAQTQSNTDSPEAMSIWDRCITRGVPGMFLPAGYNNAYRIIQTPGYVVIAAEMIDTRIIPIDGRAHRPAHLRSMTGDSVGRWEGDTLVVETTNFDNRGWVATSAATGRIKGILTSETLKVVERFRREDADTIMYTVTLTDPKMYSRPWTVSIPLEREDTYQIYEYACHEGNHAVGNILRGARVMEKEKK
jgi:hypothetical protein